MKEILTIIFTGIVILIPVFALIAILGDKSCQATYPNNKPVFSIWTNCTIEVNGQRIPAINYRIID